MARLLVIEDDQRIRGLLCRHLAEAGHETHAEGTTMEGLRHLVSERPDGVLGCIDLGLPDLDGLELLKMVRSVSDVPVLVLTAREDDPTIVSAFENGADDYVTKPVSGAHLVARVAALLRRRAESDPKGEITVGALTLKPGPRLALLNEVEMVLTPKEFDLLVALASRPGDVIRRPSCTPRSGTSPAAPGPNR